MDAHIGYLVAAVDTRMGHVSGRPGGTNGHSRSAEQATTLVVSCLLGQRVTPPIFQADDAERARRVHRSGIVVIGKLVRFRWQV